MPSATSKNHTRWPERRDKGRRGSSRRDGRRRDLKRNDEFDSVIVDLARVTRVMAGGKRMRFRACVIVGDHKGHIGMGIKKGADVQLAVAKATKAAEKKMIKVKLVAGTIPHRAVVTFRGAKVMLKPAKAGTGIIAGGAIRVMIALAGIDNVVVKMQGANNKINNVTAALNALAMMRTAEEIKEAKLGVKKIIC